MITGISVLFYLQGVKSWRKFTLTDPAIHSLNQEFGSTDLGEYGMIQVLGNHQCNELCRELGLSNPYTGIYVNSGPRSTTYSFQVTEQEILRARRIVKDYGMTAISEQDEETYDSQESDNDQCHLPEGATGGVPYYLQTFGYDNEQKFSHINYETRNHKFADDSSENSSPDTYASVGDDFYTFYDEQNNTKHDNISFAVEYPSYLQ